MCCLAKFIVKYVLLIANLLFWFAGLGLLIIGIMGLVQINKIPEEFNLPAAIEAVPIVTTIIGGVIFVVSFFGCCGAMRENKCMLYVYMVLMLILAGIKVWMASVIFINLQNLNDWVSRWVNEAFRNVATNSAFEFLETLFSCCGTTGANSYLELSRPIPDTCCPSGVTCNIDNSNGGCTTLITDYFDSFGSIIGSIIIAVVAIELVAIVFALFIAHSRRNQSRSVY